MTPKRIPLRFFLVVSLIFLYMGIVRVDTARRRLKEPYKGPMGDSPPPDEPNSVNNKNG
jgi:hypothetical protein